MLESPDLRDRAVRSAMNAAGCDEGEMERIVSDYLYHREKKLIREESRGITERLKEAEQRGDEEALRELLQRKRDVLAAMRTKSAK